MAEVRISKMKHLPNTMKRAALGFTLIELMITISIMVILLTVAVPSFREFVQSQRVKTTSFDLFSAITYARSEALKRNGDVTLSAATGGWGNGWSISAGSSTLRTQSAIDSSVAITASATSITYGRDGRTGGGAATTLQLAANPSVSWISPRCIKIDLSGRPNSKLGTCS
jgi:type IV fimbrial biogenesis protein FimT